MASSKEIEREVETQRASVESTLDALKAKMSFGQMVDEFGGYVGAGEARATLRTAGRQVRDNPVAFALVGVGLAWLMFGGDDSKGRYEERYDDFDDDFDDRDRAVAYPGASGGLRYGSAYGSPYAGDDQDKEGRLSRAASAVGDAVSGAGERISDAVSGAGARLSDAAGRAGASASRMGDGGRDRLHGMSDEMRSARRRAARSGRRATSMLAETMDRQPLLVGAFAVAVGAAIGAALPTTRAESRWMGEHRDDLIDQAKDKARDLRDQAMHAAEAGVDAASRRADEEGLTPSAEGKTLAAKVETVVKAGIDGARDEFAGDKKPETSKAGGGSA